MIETIILLLSPTIVSWIVDLQKKLQSVKYSDNKKMILRVTAAILSFGSVFATSLVTGEPLSEQFVQDAVTGALIFVATQVPYSLGKKKGKGL